MNRKNVRTECSVLLLYPDKREAALGSPGFKQVYLMLVKAEDMTVDWGWYDEKNEHVVYENRQCKKWYDYIAFSVPFELLYSHVISCLIALNIEPERRQRKPEEPAVIIGGVVPTMNPAVAGTIADVVYIGEAEQYLIETIRHYIADRRAGAARKLTPMLGMQIPKSIKAAPRFIYPKEAINSSFHPWFDNPSFSSFKGAGLVEVGRGCSRGCRFCAAGQIYLPVRHRSVESIFRDVDTYRGFAERIGLVGASISDHPYLKEIVSGIIDKGFGLTTSSFRADMLDRELVNLLKKGGLKTITIAPEGGSDRIRSIMNKGLSEEEILAAVQACAHAGIKNLRIYYMVGLPWENESDIDAIAILTGKIKNEFTVRDGRITVSVNPFIPKPQTPFQWYGMAKPTYITQVYEKLKNSLRTLRGIKLKTLSVRVAVRETVISLGDEAVGSAIIENVRDGVPWKKALANNKVSLDALIFREKTYDEIYPWDMITGVKTKEKLWSSFQKAQSFAR